MTNTTTTVHQFLTTVIQRNTSGELKEEFTCGIPTTAEHQPHILLQRRGIEAQLDFLSQEELVFRVYKRPPHRLLFRRWNIFERLRHFLYLSPSIPTGDSDLDRTWILQYVSADDAARLLDLKVRTLIKKLGLFEEMEWTDQAYRCLKAVDISNGYTPENALQDLDTLLDLAEALR